MTLIEQQYKRVNGAWPKPLPSLTGPEAASAAKRLYRAALKKPWRGSVRITSGRRRTWVRRGVLIVNPDQGWHDFVHDLSHYLHRRANPGRDPHHPSHAALERTLIEYIVAQGWLDGKLRRQEKPKPDVREVRRARVLAAIARWETKAKRAANALKKLRRQRAYYERGRGSPQRAQ